MSRRWSLVCLAVAWTVPVAWLVSTLALAPSDGTVVSSPTAVLGEGRWGSSVTVLETYGDTPLRPGDRILAVEQRSVEDLLSDRGRLEVTHGTVLQYDVRRPGPSLDLLQEIEVPLTSYPLGAAVVDHLAHVVLVVGLLLAGSLLVWRGARQPLGAATVIAGSAAAVGLAAHPFGPQAVDLVEPGGRTAHLVGEASLAVALGAVLLLALHFPRPPRSLARHPAWSWTVLTLPFVGYLVWVVAYALAQQGPARLQAMLEMVFPAALMTTAIAVPVLVTGHFRAAEPEQRVAVRLLLGALLAAALLGIVLHVLPVLVLGDPLVPWDVLGLALGPTVLACWVVAVLGYRLLGIEAALRRTFVQIMLVTVLGGLFLTGVGAVNVAAGGSTRSMVTGGVVAIILVPVALLLRRLVSRMVYGERANPDLIVSQLRRLDPTSGAEEALHETLVLLSRSLRLSYASIEGAGTSERERFHISLGELRGQPTTVVLEVAGQPLGRLDMEVNPTRDGFGPRDRRLLEDVGAQVGALVQALAANRELRRARERLVATREEERRRLRRDLHDGLGPSLASALMRLEVVRELMRRDPESASELLERITDQTEASIAEIRRLVDGLRPPVLDQLGLASALRSNADEHNQAAVLAPPERALTWSVVAEDLGVLPAAVEVAAYRIVSEAVTNAVRHSGGSACVVTVRRGEDALHLEIRDDGVGLNGARGRGVGIGSMRERAEELGGTCTVRPAPGRGTLVSATLPLTTGLSDEDTT